MIKQICIFTIFTFCLVTTSSSFLEASSEPINNDLKTTLSNYSREQLQKLAFYTEKYDRVKRGVADTIIGGLEDYIFRLTNENIIDIIVRHAETYPELKEAGKLESLAGISTMTKEESLRDFILKKDIEELRTIALAAEKYVREKENRKSIGGLHDYIRTLDKEDIVTIIMGFVETYPELAVNKTLFVISKETSFDESELREYYSQKTREELLQYGLACDEYDRVRNPRIGGIHDYIFKLNKEEILNILLTCVKLHPELSEKGELDTIKNNYNLAKPGIFGSILEYINTFSTDDLKKLALAGEQYERDVKGLHLIGGLHDYVDTLSSSQLKRIILDYVNAFPELRTPGKLEQLAGLKKVAY